MLGVLGALLIIGGTFLSKNFDNQNPKVEILGEEITATTSPNLVVEISGAVERPGVYGLTGGSRVNDLLLAAGGLSVSADRSWVEKTINKAAKLIDGQKVYIRAEGAGSNDISGQALAEQSVGGVVESGLVNINTASQKELESLPGIGPVYAANIIEQRPYSDINELINKKIIPTKTFDKIKDKISAY